MPIFPRTHTFFSILFFVGNIAVFTPTQATADSCDKWVQVIYFVPKNAPHKDRAPIMLSAYKKIQEQWSTWGWHFQLKPQVITIKGDLNCADYNSANNGKMVPEYRRKLGKAFDPDHVIYGAFGECTTDPNAVAVGGRGDQQFFAGVVDRISEGSLIHIGNIGHELGHSFDLPHEDCAQTNGIMCNNNWPNVYPTAAQFKGVAASYNAQHGWLEQCEVNF